MTGILTPAQLTRVHGDASAVSSLDVEYGPLIKMLMFRVTPLLPAQQQKAPVIAGSAVTPQGAVGRAGGGGITGSGASGQHSNGRQHYTNGAR